MIICVLLLVLRVLRLLLLALLLCSQFPFAMLSTDQNVVRVFKLLFPDPTQPVIVKGIVHETVVQDFEKKQAGVRLEPGQDISPGHQVFLREEAEFLQGYKIAPVLLESAIQVCNGSISA